MEVLNNSLISVSLTLHIVFLQFAQNNYRQYDFVLLSNDVKEWSQYLFELHRLHKYFKASIVSGNIHMRKPEIRIFSYALEYIQCRPDECIFVDNSVRNLNAAQSIGIHTVLSDRDHEIYSGKVVNSFEEPEQILKNNQALLQSPFLCSNHKLRKSTFKLVVIDHIFPYNRPHKNIGGAVNEAL